jgi:hypothetical protein
MSEVAPKPQLSVLPKAESWGLIFTAVGMLTVIISLVLQFFIIDHGSSNQLTIDAEVKKSVWGVLTGIILFVLGFVLWLWFSTWRNKYLPVFLLSFGSYVVANIAVMLSLYQVTVTPV